METPKPKPPNLWLATSVPSGSLAPSFCVTSVFRLPKIIICCLWTAPLCTVKAEQSAPAVRWRAILSFSMVKTNQNAISNMHRQLASAFVAVDGNNWPIGH